MHLNLDACWPVALGLTAAFHLLPLGHGATYTTCRVSLLSFCFEVNSIPAGVVKLDAYHMFVIGQLAAVPFQFS